jgi:hypothetical protein
MTTDDKPQDTGECFAPRFRRCAMEPGCTVSTLRASIAFAAMLLSACGGPAMHDWRDDEVSGGSLRLLYYDVANRPANSPERIMARRFLADGKFTCRELEEWNAFRDSENERDLPTARMKAELAR